MGIITKIVTRLMNEPQPFRMLVRLAIQKMRIGSAQFRYDIGAVERPHYAHIVYNAAQLAHRLGHKKVSVLEFGVAGGAGLLCLERHAEWVEKIFPVTIEIYGFDTGEGLPALVDYRDLPYAWKPGFYGMDQNLLRSKLKRSKLVIGDVSKTVPTFSKDFGAAPIGAVAHDMDFYSSTMAGLSAFDSADADFLPRLPCYFDDVVGNETVLYSDFTGERAAINDFNATHTDKKLSPAYHLTAGGGQDWHHKIWIFHNFRHPDYGRFVFVEKQELPV